MNRAWKRGEQCPDCGVKPPPLIIDNINIPQMWEQVYCPSCKAKRNTSWRLLNPEAYNILQKNWARKRRREQRFLVLDHYSNGTNKCACCGEATLEFLCVDHINGGGVQHLLAICKAENRKQYWGTELAKWLIKNNFPPGFRILCHNCNMAKGLYGKCPHRNLPEDQNVS